MHKPNRHLVIGLGQIGRPIFNILSDFYEVQGLDIVGRKPRGRFDVLHICFPYSANFISSVLRYRTRYGVNEDCLVIIHSTVPLGVSRTVSAVHSPVRGQHPKLGEGIRTFVKFFGGPRASEAAEYFRKAGIKVMIFDHAETTEALKLFDTEYYRVCIEFAHRVKRYCNKWGLNYAEVYRLPNMSYNEGYTHLGHSEYVRPILEPIEGSIGGHCVLPNSDLLALSEDKDVVA